MAHKTYLGDAVYVELDERTGLLRLTTEDGLRATNTIYLEPEVWGSLRRWVRALALSVEGWPSDD